MTGVPVEPSGSPPAGGLSVAPAPVSLRTQIFSTLDRVNLPLLASALAFDALLAVIPLMILVVAGLGYLFSSTTLGAQAPGDLIGRFLPAHAHGSESDPFAFVEHLIVLIQRNPSKLAWWIAIPASIWFSTRMFAAVRICLSQVFQVRQRPVRGHLVWSYLAGYLLAKAQDIAIVLIVLILAIGNTLTTTALGVVARQGMEVDARWSVLLSKGGQLAGQGVAFLFGIALFILLYRYASPKRLAWSGALIASLVATLGFELAKRLYGFYLRHVSHSGQYSLDVDLGAALLLIVWLWYMSLVFLIGAAVAHVWDHARRLREVERLAVKA